MRQDLWLMAMRPASGGMCGIVLCWCCEMCGVKCKVSKQGVVEWEMMGLAVGQWQVVQGGTQAGWGVDVPKHWR